MRPSRARGVSEWKNMGWKAGRGLSLDDCTSDTRCLVCFGTGGTHGNPSAGAGGLSLWKKIRNDRRKNLKIRR
jgi:hypothetical protein